MEMAMINVLANHMDSSFSDIILGSGTKTESGLVTTNERPPSDHVQVCALVDCSGTPQEVAYVVSRLVEEGFYTIKLKVARRRDPIEDVFVLEKVREAIGYQVHIRVDANKRWMYEDAVKFGNSAKHLKLQYIEEPLQCEEDIVRFCEETGLPIALDETLDNLRGDVILKLKTFLHPGVAAVVIKPNMVGGFEIAALIARWAQMHGKMVIISSTFESSLSLYTYIQFAHYLEQHKTLLYKMRKTEAIPAIAHGLGTYKWLKEDIAAKPFDLSVQQCNGVAGVFAEDAALLLNHFVINKKPIQRSYSGKPITSCFSVINDEGFSCSFRLLETEMSLNKKVIVFLHGFLGTCEEWIPIMRALSVNAQCISIDLPGHGQSQIRTREESGCQPFLSVAGVGDMLHQLLHSITTKKIVLVGYSMGARIALYMSLKYNQKIEGAVLVSGSPGLRNDSLRRVRKAQDDAKARYLVSHGFKSFFDMWYSGRLWDSLRSHPLYKQILKSREKHLDPSSVAKVLSDLSVGRQPSMWEELKFCKTPLLLTVGEKDGKFKKIAYQMQNELLHLEIDSGDVNKLCDIVEIEGCGHAVHLENPLAVINVISRYFLRS